VELFFEITLGFLGVFRLEAPTFGGVFGGSNAVSIAIMLLILAIKVPKASDLGADCQKTWAVIYGSNVKRDGFR
jgi:hypothetical protein